MKILVAGDFHGEFPSKIKKEAKNVDLIVCVGDYAGVEGWWPIVKKQLKEAQKGNPVPSGEEVVGKKKYKQLVKKDHEAGKKVLKELDDLGKKVPVLYVFGNGDDGWYPYPFDAGDLWPVEKAKSRFVKGRKNLKNITYSNAKKKGMTFVGFGGYMDIDAYFDKKNFKDSGDKKRLKLRLKRHNSAKKQFFSRLRKLNKKDRENLIFVFHYPPKGVFDKIKGYGKSNPMFGKSTGVRFYSEAIKKYKPKLVLCGHMHEYRGMKNLPGTKVPVINPGEASKGKFAVVEIDDNEKIKSVKFFG